MPRPSAMHDLEQDLEFQMRRSFAAALSALALTTALAGGATLGFSAPAQAAARYSVDSSLIGDLLANDTTKAIVLKYLPDLMSSPYFDQVKGMTLKALSGFPQSQLTEAKLKALQADLDAVK
jgi:hypothetical protein